MPNPSVVMNPQIDKKNPFAEKIYPPPGEDLIEFSTTDYEEGNALGETNKGFWGQPSCIVPPQIFPHSWIWSGVNFFCERESLLVSRCEIYKIADEYRNQRKSGRPWDFGETDLIVNHPEFFEVDDLVWIRSDYKPHGEVLKIDNIKRNVIIVSRDMTPLSDDGLRWNHSEKSLGSEEMFLIKREKVYESAQFDLSVRGFKRIALVNEKGMLPNHGLVIRGMNGLNDERRNLWMSVIWCE